MQYMRIYEGVNWETSPMTEYHALALLALLYVTEILRREHA